MNRADALRQIKPDYMHVEHKLRQAIEYRVGGFNIVARPDSLAIYGNDVEYIFIARGPNTEIASFHYLDEPEPTLYEVLDYWFRIAQYLEELAAQIAEIAEAELTSVA